MPNLRMHYDLEQTECPDWAGQSNEMSLNEYRRWYKKKRKENPKWEYYQDFIGSPEPHVCPVCGEYRFPDVLSYDVCPVCGYEDYGYDSTPDEKRCSSSMSINERKAWFAENRAKDPNFSWFPEEANQYLKKKKR